ncbi:MAG TPA: class I SAM-dependent methyltransferase [Polyangiaceae bacterium]|nr:class I SAM-dependent methyltransferase [Polyangiaceae bacterium]
MSRRTTEVTEAVGRYLLDVTVREPEVLAKLREETAKLPSAGMQISPEQGKFMALLVELIAARRCIEVGVFTGYSSLAVALALPADGRIVACDLSDEWTRIARRYWELARVSDKIELRLGPGDRTLQGLIDDGQSGSFDFAFIDADKTAYDTYYEQCLKLLRPGGLISIDNTLWGGKVADLSVSDESTLAIRALNAKVSSDPRVSSSLVPIGDGLLLARKV